MAGRVSEAAGTDPVRDIEDHVVVLPGGNAQRHVIEVELGAYLPRSDPWVANQPPFLIIETDLLTPAIG